MHESEVLLLTLMVGRRSLERPGWRGPCAVSDWEVLVYLLNAILFLLVGLQLPRILDELSGSSVAILVGQAALVSAVVIAVRVGWGFSVPYLVRALDRRPAQRARRAGPGSGW